MIRRTFTYTDYNGVNRTEDFYFNLTQAERTEMELSAYGGLAAMMMRLLDEKNTEEIVRIFKKIILSSVGQKSMDGRRFIKNDQIRDDFYQTEAYSQLFCELVKNEDDAIGKFIKGIAGITDEEAKAATEQAAAIGLMPGVHNN